MSAQNQAEAVRALRAARGENWIMERRKVSIPVREMGSVLPDLLVSVSATDATIVGATVVSPSVSEDEVASWALGCMLSPMVGTPRRPESVTLTGGRLKHLQPILKELGVSVKTVSAPDPTVDAIALMLETQAGDDTGAGLPPYIQRKSDKPEVVADFFDAAADYHKLKPWKVFDYETPLKVELHGKRKKTYYAVVMGTGGQEFGLSIYRSIDDVLRLFEAEDQAQSVEAAQSIWSVAFVYENVKDIGPDAEEEYLSHGWKIAAKSAYPSTMVLDPGGKELARRATSTELVDLTAVARALTESIKANRKRIQDEEVIEDDVREVQAGGVTIRATVNIPAPEAMEDDEDEEPPFDLSILQKSFEDPSTPLGRAQQLVREAWDEPSKGKRVKLARQAIAISSDCADAYLLLAEETARDDNERLFLLRKAVEAGRSAIGEEDFKDLEGHFWGFIETRPYMRARLALAEFYGEHGDYNQAADEYRDMLRLNPNDNQGVRYVLWGLLLRIGREDELAESLSAYSEDSSAFWYYSKALLSYRRNGDSIAANKDLAEATAQNPHVPDYLLGRKRIPIILPAHYASGSDDEAILCVDTLLDPWKSTPGAMEWLKKQAKP